MHPLEQRLRLGGRLALQALRHQRCRGLRDRAALALEAEVVDDVAVQPQVERQVVAADRVEALGLAVGVLQLAVVARPPVVVQDDLLVQVGQLGH